EDLGGALHLPPPAVAASDVELLHAGGLASLHERGGEPRRSVLAVHGGHDHYRFRFHGVPREHGPVAGPAGILAARTACRQEREPAARPSPLSAYGSHPR